MVDRPPEKRSQFYKEVLFKPGWLAVLAAWSIVSNSDTITEKFIKPFVAPETWKKWESIFITTNWPWYVWLIGASVIVLLGAVETGFRLYRAARQRGDKAILDFEAYRTRQLELSWNPAEEPYRWWDMSQSVPVLYFRLRVKNISGVTVNGIKVELSELTPRALACVPCPIRLMNNILPLNEPVHSFSLNPGDKNFIDLMLQSKGMEVFWILHAVKDYKVEVPKQAYRMAIRISAIDVPEILRTYELVEDGELWNLREIPGLT
jgi:hypothetical protein